MSKRALTNWYVAEEFALALVKCAAAKDLLVFHVVEVVIFVPMAAEAMTLRTH